MVYGERFKVKSERELVKFFLSQISFHCTFLIKPHTHSPQWGQQQWVAPESKSCLVAIDIKYF